MITCPTCGTQHPDGAAFCDECGAKLGAGGPSAPASAQPAPTAVAMTTCPSCGASVTPGEAFCENCGAGLESKSHQQGPQPPASGGGGALTCPSCGTQLEPGSKFCDMCGTPVDQQAGPTPDQQAWQQQRPVGQQAGPTPDQQAWQQQAMPSAGRLVVQSTNATLPFPPGKTEITIGREDPVSNVFPDIDLTDHGGDEAGVSREHARITVQGSQVLIEDLNSTNFTYVNQQKLTVGQAHPLNDGDEVRLGKLKLNYYAT